MFHLIKKKDKDLVHVNDLDQLIGQIQLIDIREEYEYKSGSIQTASNIPMWNLLKSPEQYLRKDTKYYILCHSGARSSMVVKELKQKGYDVINVAGGVGSYQGTKRT